MKSKRGQILIFVLLFIPVLLVVISFTLATGKMVYYRIKLQDATDAATYTAALWQARGLNVISDLNWALVAASGGDILKMLAGSFDMKLMKAVQKVQLGAQKSFAGVSALAMYKNFEQNIGKAKPIPLILTVKDSKMFSLRVRRKKLDIPLLGKVVELYMEKDEPTFWINQSKTGPVIKLVGIRFQDKFVFGSGILGMNIPQMYSVAQAMPVRSGDKYSGTSYLGGLWDPSFYAKLTPVDVKVPLIKGLILH